ncbi:MAG: 4-hydroxy-3-methylbut-2-enyl diphosphate reductase [Lachnospiraceae bacterium]|nr:4-hydroxy-3-methylbut-2-enyl diphosphate reductase [Lachnospiraceae bacterium]
MIKVAKTAGFCFGVKLAVNKVYKLSEDNSLPIYTYGPIIHNEEVIKELSERGVKVIDNLDKLSEYSKGIIVIRSHGVTKKEEELLRKSSFTVEDATCPNVKKIHNTVNEHAKMNETILIIGDKNHPEVIGIKGWCENTRVEIIDSVEEAEKFTAESGEKICVVSQTTFNLNKFEQLVEIIRKKRYDINVINTICNATRERQEEAKSLAAASDCMIVIGSMTSSNTRKLYEICLDTCANTYYIQTINDLEFDFAQEVHSVGITAGASTPNKLIEEVQTNVRNKF